MIKAKNVLHSWTNIELPVCVDRYRIRHPNGLIWPISLHACLKGVVIGTSLVVWCKTRFLQSERCRTVLCQNVSGRYARDRQLLVEIDIVTCVRSTSPLDSGIWRSYGCIDPVLVQNFKCFAKIWSIFRIYNGNCVARLFPKSFQVLQDNLWSLLLTANRKHFGVSTSLVNYILEVFLTIVGLNFHFAFPVNVQLSELFRFGQWAVKRTWIFYLDAVLTVN